jgi:hypothetical protein
MKFAMTGICAEAASVRRLSLSAAFRGVDGGEVPTDMKQTRVPPDSGAAAKDGSRLSSGEPSSSSFGEMPQVFSKEAAGSDMIALADIQERAFQRPAEVHSLSS